MAEDWSNLADDYEDYDDILIGKVDCTKDKNRPLCGEFGVTGYPTLLYGDVVNLKEYRGPRDLGDLRDAVEEYLTEPLCGVSHPELCAPEMKQKIEEFIAMGEAKLDEKIEQLEKRMEYLEKQRVREVDKLRRTYSAALANKKKDKEELGKEILEMKKILDMEVSKDGSRDEL
jgi:Thioredoxin